MSKQVVFMVHGMGVHPEGWSGNAWDLLKRTYEDLDQSHLWPWDESFERVEIRYDNVFEDIRQRWKEDSGKVLDELGQGGLQSSAVTKIAETAERLGEDDFVTTHILDVLFYRFIDTVREAVKVEVGRQISEKLAELPGAKWSVIAHSLGTAVTHDSLHALAVGNDSPTSAVRRARLLVTLANVSRVLQTDVKAYQSRVKPALPDRPGVLHHFLDVHHKWDPVPAVRPFDPHDDWPDSETRNAGRFREIKLTAFSGTPNVHGLEHYLRDPNCYVPMFRRLTMPELIPEEEANALRTAFLKEHPQSGYDKLRKRLEKMFRKKTGNHRDLVMVLRELFEEVRNA